MGNGCQRCVERDREGAKAQRNDPFILTILDEKATVTEIAKSGLHLAARRLAETAIRGDFVMAEFVALNDAIEKLRELRQCTVRASRARKYG